MKSMENYSNLKKNVHACLTLRVVSESRSDRSSTAVLARLWLKSVGEKVGENEKKGNNEFEGDTCKRGAIRCNVFDTLNRILGTGSDVMRITSGRTSYILKKAKMNGDRRDRRERRERRGVHKRRGK